MAEYTKYPFKDYGNDIFIANFPQEYLEDDPKHGNRLMHYLITVKNSLDLRDDEIRKMQNLISPLDIPEALISNLADAIGVGVDEYEPIEFQRSIVNNAVQYYVLKGTRKAYQIRGLMSGFDAEIINLWSIDPMWDPFIDNDHKIEIPPGSGQWYSYLSPIQVSGVSGSVPYYGDCTYCLSGYIGLRVTIQKIPEKAYETNVLDRIIVKIREIMPIHVRQLFVELIVDFHVDASIQSISRTEDETSYINVGEAYRFDLWPADFVPTDIGLQVFGSTGSG